MLLRLVFLEGGRQARLFAGRADAPLFGENP